MYSICEYIDKEHGGENAPFSNYTGISVYTILPSFFNISVASNYVIWFIIIYLIAAYIRLYPKPFMEKRGLWGVLTLVALVFSWISVLGGIYEFKMTGNRDWYFWVADSNKILALVTAVCAFMFFKNLRLGYSPIINHIAASAFGVLLIHANSDAMRKWLWIDTLKNPEMLTNEYFFIHAIVSVIIIYVICTIIDMLRIALIEKPFFEKFLASKTAK